MLEVTVCWFRYGVSVPARGQMKSFITVYPYKARPTLTHPFAFSGCRMSKNLECLRCQRLMSDSFGAELTEINPENHPAPEAAQVTEIKFIYALRCATAAPETTRDSESRFATASECDRCVRRRVWLGQRRTQSERRRQRKL